MSTPTPFHARRATDRLSTFSGNGVKRSVRVCKIELSGCQQRGSKRCRKKPAPTMSVPDAVDGSSTGT
jgi:hypothetical protein